MVYGGPPEQELMPAGYCQCARCGGDIEFIEAILDSTGDTYHACCAPVEDIFDDE